MMADLKNIPTPPGAVSSPEAMINAKITELQSSVMLRTAEIKVLEGKIGNRDPLLSAKLQKENKALRMRADALERAFELLISDTLKARSVDDARHELEVQRQATIEFCKLANVDPEIWKNIAY